MRPEALGLIIGGLVPACLYGLTNLAGRAGMQTSMGAPLFLICAAIGVCLGGGALYWWQPTGGAISWRSCWIAIGYGSSWSIASGLVLLAHSRYNVPMSKLIPLFNLNTIVSVVLLLLIYREWEGVSIIRLILGTIFATIGATLVALS